MNPIIDIQSLSKTFKGKNRNTSVTALRNLTLQVEPGKVFGFVGPNGAGKSTTIKILMGLIKASGGTASLNSTPVTSYNCRERVGYLPENPVFHDFLTAAEVLQTTAALRGIKKEFTAADISFLLNKVNLPNDPKRPVRNFSKGMTQRLGIANALIGNPELLIFDEPMSGLDPLGRNLVRELILELRGQKKTIFFSSHILHDVETICDEVAILIQGKLQFQGNLETITAKENGNITIQFNSDKEQNDLDKALLQPLLNKLSANIFELSLSNKKLSATVQTLLDLQCTITNIQQDHSTLENFFLQLIKDTNHTT